MVAIIFREIALSSNHPIRQLLRDRSDTHQLFSTILFDVLMALKTSVAFYSKTLIPVQTRDWLEQLPVQRPRILES